MTRTIRNPSLYFLLLFACFFSVFPGYSRYREIARTPSRSVYRDLPAFFLDQSFSLYPVRADQAIPPNLTAEGVFVIDVASAVPMHAKNADKPLYPASTTKMMTALVARSLYDLDEVLTVPDIKYEGSLMRLEPGEKITVRNLLRGLLIASGNDAAEVLAFHHPQGREGFIAQMNQEASRLGLRNTRYFNPSGLPDSLHMSTAWDLGQLAVYVLRDTELRQIVRQQEMTVYGVTGERHVLKTTNKLLGVVSGLDGVKTGYTDEAGEVLVSSVTRDDHQVVIVLLKSTDRFSETTSLVDWIYKAHTWKDISFR
jgi:serine-type D-Ala-D-Ala carboxypeptidase (penicillin-binding protein 5/6)